LTFCRDAIEKGEAQPSPRKVAAKQAQQETPPLRKQSSIGSAPFSKQKDKSAEKDKMNGAGGLRINEMSIEEINKLIEERVLKVCVCVKE
jgi:hypothetical protein